MPISASASGCFSTGSLHSLQIRRARRCARIEVDRRGDEERLDAHVEEARDRRRRVVGVQRREHEVAGERGLDRDLGGLEVANLADHDDVRVLPQERAQRGREVEPDVLVHLHLVDARAGCTRPDLRRWRCCASVVLSSCSAEYSVVVLPEPVGPVTSTMPYGFWIAFLKSSSCLSSKPSLVMSSCRFALSRRRMTIFSPNSVGRTETRKSISLSLPILSLMRPSCGRRRSAMSSDAMILRREVIAFRSLSGGRISSWSTPSMR